MRGDLRERAHDVLRQEMTEMALELILDRGYDVLTADELARNLRVSRATFFRYLGSKDELIVAAMLGPLDLFSKGLRESEHEPGTSLWAHLRSACDGAADLADQEPQRQRQRIALVQSLPAVGAQLRRARVPQIEDLARELEREGVDQLTSGVLAAATVAVLDRCWVSWLGDDRVTLRSVLDEAFLALAAAGREIPVEANSSNSHQ